MKIILCVLLVLLPSSTSAVTPSSPPLGDESPSALSDNRVDSGSDSSDVCGQPGAFPCNDDGSECIPIDWVCDGIEDCTLGNDESNENCTYNSTVANCELIILESCQDVLPYRSAIFPNTFADTQSEAKLIVSSLPQETNCSQYALLFACAMAAPGCSVSGEEILPCRSFCQQLQANCSSSIETIASLNCDLFPVNSVPALCPNETVDIVSCGTSEFKCDNGTCIADTRVCDGTEDCLFGEDEQASLCSTASCSGDQFTCVSDGSCIPIGWFCDGTYDCLDASDENHTNCNQTACAAYQFECESDNSCIPGWWFCDGIIDCKDASDEFHTNCNQTCASSDYFVCQSTDSCIPVEWLCDGIADCADGSDENNTDCHQSQQDFDQCVNITSPQCTAALPYNRTMFPNDMAANQTQASLMISQLENFAFCSEYLMLLSCATAMPECPTTSNSTVLPCRSLCEQVAQDCGVFLGNDTVLLQCNDLPEAGHPDIYCPDLEDYDQCVNVTLSECSAILPYRLTLFPNDVATSVKYATVVIKEMTPFENCSEYLTLFSCAAVMPECSDAGGVTLPCRALCEQVLAECGEHFGNDTGVLQCDNYPESGNPDIYCPGFSNYQCENITLPECKAALPYELAAFPNRMGMNQTGASNEISRLQGHQNCSEYFMLFACAVTMPECSPSKAANLPCRSLCEQVLTECGVDLANNTEMMQCDLFPEMGNPNLYCPGLSNQCENITVSECNATLPYDITVFPNRVAENQTHASAIVSELKPFQNCSEYLMLFACAAALPECTRSSLAFPPCRALCEQVAAECGMFFANDTSWLQCDNFPEFGNPDIFCPVSCELDEFMCKDDPTCIPIEWFCDGIDDCADASDENNTDCTQRINSTCLLNQFECSPDECISGEFYCDGLPDCAEKEDEHNCTVAYGSRKRSLQCESITVTECQAVLPYNNSVFPNTFADDQQFAAGMIRNLSGSLDCSEHAWMFACALFLPECSGDGQVYLPCRSLCEVVRTACEHNINGLSWVNWGVDCRYFPEFGVENCWGDVVQPTEVIPTTAPTEPPIISDLDVSITCLSNCYLDAVAVNSPFVAVVQCSNCPSSYELSVRWVIKQANQRNGIYHRVEVDDDFSSTGMKSEYLSINANQLDSGSFYKLKANVSLDEVAFGVDKMRFTTNSPPANGECTATPSTGYALETNFVVACSGWEDVHTPLRYEVYSRTSGSSVTSLSYAGYGETSTEFLLPMGYESQDYLVEITVKVVDIYNAEGTFALTVTVEPPSITGDDLTERLTNLTSGEDSALGELIQAGDTGGAAALVITVASVLNTQSASDTGSEDVEERRELRESVIDDLKSISGTAETVDQVSELANALVAMTSVPEELTDNSQVNSALAIEDLSGALVGMKNESEDDIISTAFAITQSASNVLSVSVDSSDDAAETTITNSQSSTITKSVVKTVDSISEAVLSKRVPGQPPVVFNTSTLSVQLQRDRPGDIAETALESNSGRFQLPSAAALFGDQANSSYVDTQFLTFTGNPFDWDNSSAYIASDVISLSFSSEDGSDITVNELEDDIVIELPKSSSLPEPEPVNMTNMDDDSGLLVYGIDVPDGMAVHFLIIPDGGNNSWDQLNYTLYFRRGAAPSQSDYNYTGVLPNLEHESEADIDDSSKEELRGTFFVPSTVIGAADSYYVGVHSDLSTWNFNVQIFTSGCKYWDESVEQWKSDGCFVSNKSSSSMTYCECNHLTSFASDFFVPPNTIDFDTVFAKFADLKNNLSVFLMVFLILVLYIPIMVWARWQDKKDVEKWGVTPLPDNQPREKYLYQVTVYTGMRSGAGTKSNVFVMMAGENGSTRARPLKDKKRKMFQRGSKCTFLMAEAESLGDLYSLRIWHDNSGRGRHASWYLSKVVVCDVQTKECYHFLCERWLAVEEDDCQVQRVLPAASRQDLARFNQLFVANAKKDFTDGHIWFSVVSRPSRSHFTRVQRVSCCLSILYTSMIANCMWYNTEGSSVTSRVIELGPFTFTLHSIYVGVMSSLIVFPVNLMLIQLFRKSRPKEMLIAAEKDPPPAEPVEKHAAVAATNADAEAGDKRKKSTHDVDRILKDIKRDIEEADKEYERRISYGFPYRKFSFASKAANSDVELLLKSGSGTPDSVAGEEKKKESVYGGIKMADNISTTTTVTEKDQTNGSVTTARENGVVAEEKPSDGASEDRRDAEKKTKTPFTFPHWCVYIAWCLVFLSSALSAFFTILYSMEWGNDKSIDWLVSFLTSFVQSVFVIQPIKVLCIAILLAIIFRNPDGETEVYNVKLQDDEEYMHSKHDSEDIIRYEPPPLAPPDPVKLEGARLKRQKEVRMWQLTKEIITYVLYLIVIYILAFSNRSIDTFYQHQAIDNVFFQNDEFESIDGFAGLGAWLTDVLLPGLYPTEWYNGDNLPSQERHFIEGLTSYRIGSPRLRHLRVRHGLCQVLRQFADLIPACYEEYSMDSEDESSYSEFWLPYNDTLNTGEPWLYRPSDELDGMPIYGKTRMFYGGGYVAELGMSIGRAQSRIDYLWSSLWFDHVSRALFIEFPLYNANANLFSMVTLLVEFPATGGALLFRTISVLRLYHFVGSFWIFYLTCELIFIAFVVYFIVREVLKIKRKKWSYFKSYWSWVEMVKLALCVSAIFLAIYQHASASFAADTIASQGPTEFVNLQTAAARDEVYLYILGSIVFLSFLKLINILRFNRRMALLARTLRHASKDFIYYAIVFFIVMFAYGQSYYLLVGSKTTGYRTFTTAIESLFSTWLGQFDYDDISDAGGVLGSIFFFTFNLFMYAILMTMFITIIIVAFLTVKADNDREENKYEMLNFLSTNIKEILGIGGSDSDDEECDNDTEEIQVDNLPSRTSSKTTVHCEDEVKKLAAAASQPKAATSKTAEKYAVKSPLPTVNEILPAACNYYCLEDLKERINVISTYMDAVLLEESVRKGKFVRTRFIIDPDTIYEENPTVRVYQPKYAFGEETVEPPRPSPLTRVPSFMREDAVLPFESKAGRCHLCRAKTTTKSIECHVMLRCPTIRPCRADMLRNMVEVIGEIQTTLVRDKARLWWKFYKENAKVIRLAYVNERTNSLKIKKASMKWFDLPKKVQKDISRVILDYFDKALLKGWQTLPRKTTRCLNLHDFVVD